MSELDRFFEEMDREVGASPDRDIDDAFVNVALNVARIRRDRGLTQAELAERVGTSQPRIAEFESAQGNPTLRTLAKVALALEVPLAAIVGEPRENVPVWNVSAALERSDWIYVGNTQLASAA